MANNWKEYQEETAVFFRSLGLDAETDVTVQGIRTQHDIDVLVRSHHAGFDVTWIVECKHWKTCVSKLHVLALREIVADLGADRGLLLCEVGFQSGAMEASRLTNVHVTSLAELSTSASRDILAMRVYELFDRVNACKERYWDIPKQTRIEYGLRPNTTEFGYSAIQAAEVVGELLTKAFRGVYPFTVDTLYALAMPDFPKVFASLEQVVATSEEMVQDIEERLARVN